MNLRALALAVCAVAFSVSAFAQTPDLAAIARSSGTPDIPGLKMAWPYRREPWALGTPPRGLEKMWPTPLAVVAPVPYNLSHLSDW